MPTIAVIAASPLSAGDTWFIVAPVQLLDVWSGAILAGPAMTNKSFNLCQPLFGDIEAYARERLPCLRGGIDCTEFGDHGCMHCHAFRAITRLMWGIWQMIDSQ